MKMTAGRKRKQDNMDVIFFNMVMIYGKAIKKFGTMKVLKAFNAKAHKLERGHIHD